MDAFETGILAGIWILLMVIMWSSFTLIKQNQELIDLLTPIKNAFL